MDKPKKPDTDITEGMTPAQVQAIRDATLAQFAYNATIGLGVMAFTAFACVHFGSAKFLWLLGLLLLVL